ncbi:MAG: pyruvate kinase [Candidatus Taylorbacteria bacterium]|nr:pyruvate kinase [Candidatus Taylorbacteria bacterium]
MKHSKAQIVATIGPASSTREILKTMIEHQLDVVRLNFSWADLETRVQQIELVRQLEKECGRKIPIIQDLPGPRVQKGSEHTYDHGAVSIITERDEEFIEFGVLHKMDYIAMSFVGSAEDVNICREIVRKYSGRQRIIAKIERKAALDSIDEIIAVSDAIMVARGDLGNEIPLEKIPFAQAMIIKKCKEAGKPVITATQMLLSMVESPVPTRAEVTDVANAILQGSDAVMLSEETAKGKYPIEVITMMEKIVLEAEKHMGNRESINHL